jgi:prolyl-tRNA editing enzyme YbaK/EbsC (Cys-tRNA(Pro) deacylase)
MKAVTNLKEAAQRVQDHATALGLDVTVVEMPASTRTAEEAASACGCAVGQIVKSLVFCNAETDSPVLILVSGANRVHEKRTAQRIGAKLRRPDADYVREATGFAIGGIPPFAHASPLATYVDRELLSHDLVWAAAGTPNSVFSISPRQLADATAATIIEVT